MTAPTSSSFVLPGSLLFVLLFFVCVWRLSLFDEPVIEGAATGAEEKVTAHLGRQKGASTSRPGCRVVAVVVSLL